MSTIKVYITKYALTDGIEEAVCKQTDHPSMIERVGTRFGNVYYHGEGREWHRTIESAKERAYAMRDAKIKSLEKSLKKMKAMHFES